MRPLFVCTVLLFFALLSATASAGTLYRLTGYSGCGGGRIAGDYEVYDTGPNGGDMKLLGWLYEACDGTSKWVPATARTSHSPGASSDGAEEQAGNPISDRVWAIFHQIAPTAVRRAIATGTPAEILIPSDEELDKLPPAQGPTQHGSDVK